MTAQAITRAQGMPSTCVWRGAVRALSARLPRRAAGRKRRARAISAVSLSSVMGSVNTYTGRAA